MPEIWHWEELSHIQKFQTDELDVICMPCAMCKSNSHVEVVRPSFDQGIDDVRFYAGLTHPTAVVSQCYKCTNPNCPAVKARMAKSKVEAKDPDSIVKLARQYAHHFRSTAAEQLEMLPTHVRGEYRFVLLRTGGYSLELADFLLTSAANSMQVAAQLADMWGRRAFRAHQESLTFAHTEQLKAQARQHQPKQLKITDMHGGDRHNGNTDAVSNQTFETPVFPLSKPIPDTSIMGVPSAKSLDGFVDHAYNALKQHIHDDLMTRKPGRFMCSDGTFKIAKITMSEGRVAILFIGEDGTICGFYIVESESWANLELALHQLAERLEWLGCLNELMFWYTDNCCGGCAREKLGDHLLCKIFPGIMRCPLADAFHT